MEVMKFIDVLVDGEFIAAQKDVQLYWRGSTNQRVIDVPAALKKGEIVESASNTSCFAFSSNIKPPFGSQVTGFWHSLQQ